MSRAEQTRRLCDMLRAVRADNPFYRVKLSAAGDIASMEDFQARVPFTYKAELVEDQRLNPPFGSNLTFALGRYTRFFQTSGTSGHPLHWLDTDESWDWMCSLWEGVFEAGGVAGGDRVFFAFSFGPFLGFWVAFGAAGKMGCMAIPGGGMTSNARLRVLLDTHANVLCCTPTYAIRLAQVAAEEGVDLAASAVRTIVVAGEPGASIPATRALLEKLWPGTKIVDHHGMTETGPVSYECPKRRGVLHVIEREFVAEVIDSESGQLLPEGTRGELVLTNLGRWGSPVIRYRTGDIVQPSRGRCECGSDELALEGGILARTDDMVVIRGVNVYPSAIDQIMRECGGVAEYRVEVAALRGMVELRIQVEPEAEGNAAALAHHLEAEMRNAFGLRIPIATVAVGSLPRFEMKAKRWVRVSEYALG